MINYVLNRKATIVILIVGLIKKISLYKISYFPEPYIHSKKNKEIKLDFHLSNYAKIIWLKNVTGADTSKCANKNWFSSLKSIIGKLDMDKLETTRVDLSQ